MDSGRIKEIQKQTGYPNSTSVMVALNQVWNECAQEQSKMYSEEDLKLFARNYFREIKLDMSNTAWDELADRCLEQFKKK